MIPGSARRFDSGPSCSGICGLQLGLAGWGGVGVAFDWAFFLWSLTVQPTAGLVLKMTAGLQVQPKGKLSGLWKPRIGTSIASVPSGTFYWSKLATGQLRLKAWRNRLHFFWGGAQSIAAILQSTALPPDTAQQLLPSVQAYKHAPGLGLLLL